QFYSDSSSNPINLTALSNISFTYESQTFTTEEVNISLNDVAFVIQFQSISSIHNLTEFKSNFEIFPNPNNGNFSLFFDTENVTPLKLTIYNLLGEAIFVDNISPKIGQNVFNLNIKNSLQKINSGVYYLHLENQYFNKTQKIVLK